jgi:hypothetical protein
MFETRQTFSILFFLKYAPNHIKLGQKDNIKRIEIFFIFLNHLFF